MLKKLTLAENALDSSTWETFEVEDVCEFLLTKFENFPSTARIYKNQVSQDCDVTPSDELSIERLRNSNGPFYVVVYPGDPVTITVAVVAVAAIAAATYLLQTSDAPKVAEREVQSSPNNALSDRQNSVRLNGRIPDIYGEVRSTPDLLANPYTIFENNREVEYSYMCVGQGEYQILEDGVKDGDTKVNDIVNASVEIYGPDSSPNSGNTPQLSIGEPIDEPVYSTVRSNSVNGQTLLAPNQGIVVGNSDIRMLAVDEVELFPTSDDDFRRHFEVGDPCIITNASYTGTVGGTPTTIDLSGSYFVTSVLKNEVRLEDPASVNSDWNVLATFDGGGQTSYFSPTLSIVSSRWVGPFVLDLDRLDQVFSNIVAPGGLYKDDGEVQEVENVSVQIELTPIDENGTQIGLSELFAGTVQGSSISKKQRALTLKNSPSFNGRCEVRALRTSDKDYNFDGQVLDEVVWRDCYAVASLNVNRYYTFVTNNEGFVPFSGSSLSWVSSFLTASYSSGSSGFGTYVSLPGMRDGTRTKVTFTLSNLVDISDVEISIIANLNSCSNLENLGNGTHTVYLETFAAIGTPDRIYNTGLSFYSNENSGSFTVSNVTVQIGEDWVEFPHFGEITTVQSKTVATLSALSIKNRKLNMQVTRKVPAWISGENFTTALFATKRAGDIFSAICLNPLIGNRSKSEIDFDSVYDTIAEVEAYFGLRKAVEFSYTFDNDNLSFEEIASNVANAVHCNAFRQGSKIKFSFEKETEDSVLLFNHRNKLPGSETRTIRFGNQNVNDGIEYEYVNPSDDSIETLYLPEDRSAQNPKKIETIGIRNKIQAYFHAWRLWNKIQYQNIASEFEATQEADLLILGDRILVADGTRPDIQDGQVVSQNGLELTLSQNVNFLLTEHPYSIFLQHTDGSVESLGVSPGSTDKKVVLASAPKQALSLNSSHFAVATYLIVGNNEKAASAFLLTEKNTRSNFTSQLQAINYDSKYYSNDKDFENGVIDEDGNHI